MKKIFLIWLVLSVGIWGQTSKTGALSGYIYEASNGEGLIGANVFIEKLGIGASANLNGFFSLPNIPLGEHTVTISFIGYKPQKIKTKITADNNKILKVYLETDVLQSSEVVVVDSIRISDKLYSKPVSKIEMTSQQINSIPRVVEADLLRSLQTLPGVQSLSDFSSALYIRGGTPDQNLYLIDGADVYNPEHAFGLFSTFNTNAIKKAELSKGGFSADYGGRLSSVLNVINLDGNRNNFQGDISISLLAASTTLQAPLGSFGSISASFRRTYLDQTIAKVMDDIPSYYFLDGNVKAFLDISDKDKVVISFYGGEDDLDYQFDADKPESPHFKYRWGNVTGSVNWRRILTPKLFANFWITGSRFSSDMSLDEIDLREENEIGD
ncbi:MAG TPA: TonB-dependent receptor, partial [Ignavibacteriales bacterium]|nr:TonB-dependent receptor [Ignavibacteriales bacterium]